MRASVVGGFVTCVWVGPHVLCKSAQGGPGKLSTDAQLCTS